MPTATGAGLNLNNLDRFRSKLGLEWEDVASIIGVDRTTIYRWRNQEASPRPIARTRIVQLNELMQLLTRTFAGPDLARAWLKEATPDMLGGKATPLDVMRQGRIDRVLTLLQFLARGA
jgi:DNA-binding XRE family transcriptional regulator